MIFRPAYHNIHSLFWKIHHDGGNLARAPQRAEAQNAKNQ